MTSGWPERHYWLSVNVYSQNSNRTRNAHSFFSIQFRFELKRQYHKTVGGGKNDCSQSIPSHLRFRDSMKPIWADVRTKLGNRCQIVKFASVLPDMTPVASARHSITPMWDGLLLATPFPDDCVILADSLCLPKNLSISGRNGQRQVVRNHFLGHRCAQPRLLFNRVSNLTWNMDSRH